MSGKLISGAVKARDLKRVEAGLEDFAPAVAAGQRYALEVARGLIPACRWVRLACERQLADLLHGHERGIYFDATPGGAADRVLRFFALIRHIKGELRGERIRLEPWQAFRIGTVFGWVREDGLRRFRTAYNEVGRKNAKSTELAGLGLYALAGDGEGGAEVYSAATSRDQAKIVFNAARAMVLAEPELRKRIEPLKHNLSHGASDSKFEPLSSDYNSLDGLNIHFGAVDELHAHKTRDLWDVLDSGTGARAQPLLWIITTAGTNRLGICYEQRSYTTKILERVHEDDSHFGVIYTADREDLKNDGWLCEHVWRKANPNYGVSVKPDDLSRLATKARVTPSARANFLTKRLCVWVNASEAWLDMTRWREAPRRAPLESLAEKRCWVGLDLSSKLDITAKLLLFPDEVNDIYHLFGQYYLPEEVIDDDDNPNREHYRTWAEQGYLMLTPGNVIDYDEIKDDLRDDGRQFRVQAIGFDPWNAQGLANDMAKERAPMIEVPQTVRSLSEPMKTLQAMVRARKIAHGSCPVLAWMASNLVGHLDNKDNAFPRKERQENKIDGIVGLLIAMMLYLREAGPGVSIYDEREVRIL
jgi:phage terminase large subunit-like protein